MEGTLPSQLGTLCGNSLPPQPSLKLFLARLLFPPALLFSGMIPNLIFSSPKTVGPFWLKYPFQSFSGSGLVLVLHWVAGEQGHSLNEFSNPSNGSYCDFTKERGKVRSPVSYFKKRSKVKIFS